MMNNALLSLSGCTVTFNKQNKPLIQDFSFTCAEPGLYLIHGANGAGKSTLFQVIQGKDIPASVSGALQYGHQTFRVASTEYKLYAHTYSALVPQKYDTLLIPGYTVQENLAMALCTRIPSCYKGLCKVSIPTLLKEVGIPLDRPIELLSGGQRQITAIMMALQKPRKILLLDEPTATLDPVNTALVMNFLVRLQQETGILIIMICHDPDLQKYTPHQPIVVG